MAVIAQRILVTEVETFLGTTQNDDQSILFTNVGANELRLVGKGQAWADGYPVAAGKEIAVDTSKSAGDSLYAIAQNSGATSTLALLRVGA